MTSYSNDQLRNGEIIHLRAFSWASRVDSDGISWPITEVTDDLETGGTVDLNTAFGSPEDLPEKFGYLTIPRAHINKDTGEEVAGYNEQQARFVLVALIQNYGFADRPMRVSRSGVSWCFDYASISNGATASFAPATSKVKVAQKALLAPAGDSPLPF